MEQVLFWKGRRGVPYLGPSTWDVLQPQALTLVSP